MKRHGRRDLRVLQSLFLATMVFLVSVLGILAWRISVQESALTEHRNRAQQESAADRIVATLHQELATIDAVLEGIARTGEAPPNPGGDAVYAYLSPEAVRAWPRDQLAFYPDGTQPIGLPGPAFDKAERLEYRSRDFPAALAEYQRLAKSPDPETRALALLGAARTQLNAGRPDNALATYDTLRALDETVVVGLPAGLAALLGSLSVHHQRQDESRVRDVAAHLRDALMTHRYTLSRASYVSIRDQLQASAMDLDDDPALGVAAAIAESWHRAQEIPAGRLNIDRTAHGSHLVAWRRVESATAVFAIPAAAIPREWLPGDAAVDLVTDAGTVARSGGNAASGHPSIRLASTTRLPWTVQVSTTIAPAEQAAAATRQRLLLSGLGVLAVLISVGGVLVGRAVTRELSLARMQADFVSGVSHEFRTPLTALIQTSELLARGRVADETERADYYRALHAESLRLHRLVENLLMFGALDAGQFRITAAPIDVRALLTETVRQCSRGNPAAEGRIQIQDTTGAVTARGDCEALQMMLANLIDNALKYSPAPQPVTVKASPASGGGILLEVEDHGIGISAAERERVFEKFVRGTGALERQIRGTGVGLALAREIARAHGGDIKVESEPGAGSRFIVRLA